MFGVLLVPGRRGRRLIAPVLLVAVPMGVTVGVLLAESRTDGVRWSPYYKIDTQVFEYDGVPILSITANGVPHQIAAAADDRVRWEPQYAAAVPAIRAQLAQRRLDRRGGSGTDVAMALQNGAQHVDAVEIDPVLLELGRELHPDRPYSDPRVTTHVDDGRAFLSGTFPESPTSATT